MTNVKGFNFINDYKIVLSPDAPSLLISNNNGTKSYLFIDDLSHAIATREYDIAKYKTKNCNTYSTTITNITTNCEPCVNSSWGCKDNKYCCIDTDYAYQINTTSFKRSIGLNNFLITGGDTSDTFIARA